MTWVCGASLENDKLFRNFQEPPNTQRPSPWNWSPHLSVADSPWLHSCLFPSMQGKQITAFKPFNYYMCFKRVCWRHIKSCRLYLKVVNSIYWYAHAIRPKWSKMMRKRCSVLRCERKGGIEGTPTEACKFFQSQQADRFWASMSFAFMYTWL